MGETPSRPFTGSCSGLLNDERLVEFLSARGRAPGSWDEPVVQMVEQYEKSAPLAAVIVDVVVPVEVGVMARSNFLLLAICTF